MTAHELSAYLRKGDDPNLRRRRAVVCLSLGAAATMGLIAAYQVGVIERLPEPRIPGFNSAKIASSDQAYARFDTPDAFLGIGSYAVTAILAAAGGKDRAKSRPWLTFISTGKVLFDAANALKLTWNEKAAHKTLCLYCLFATALTLGMVPLALPEIGEAIRRSVRRPAKSVTTQLDPKHEV